MRGNKIFELPGAWSGSPGYMKTCRATRLYYRSSSAFPFDECLVRFRLMSEMFRLLTRNRQGNNPIVGLRKPLILGLSSGIDELRTYGLQRFF